MKRIFLIAFLLTLTQTFFNLTANQYYIGWPFTAVEILDNRLFVYAIYPLASEPPTYSIGDTLGIYSCTDCGDDLYLIEPIDSAFIKPYDAMSLNISYGNDSQTDSITYRIYTPNIHNNLHISLLVGDVTYDLIKTDNSYKVAVPKKSTEMTCRVIPNDLSMSSALSPEGLFFGPLEYQWTINLPVDTDFDRLQSVDITLPNLKWKTFSYWYTPGLYIKANDNSLNWLGSILDKTDKFWD